MKNLYKWVKSKKGQVVANQRTVWSIVGVLIIATLAAVFLSTSLLRPRVPAKAIKELTGKRTPTSQTFYNSKTGEYTSKFYSQPVNYKDSEGKWQKIDTEIEAEGSKLEVSKAPYNLFFFKDISKPLTFKIDKYSVSFAPLTPTTNHQPRTTIIKNKALYKNIYKNTDLERIAMPSGLKQNYILKAKGHPTTFEESLKTSLTPKLAKDGSINFYKGKELVATAPQPYLKDAKGKVVRLNYKVDSPAYAKASAGKQKSIVDSKNQPNKLPTPAMPAGRQDSRLLTLRLPSSLSGLTYPITVDPTIDYSLTSLRGYLRKSASSYAATLTATPFVATGGLLRMGQEFTGTTYYIWRSYLSFDSSSIPDGALVGEATLYIKVGGDWSDTDFDVQTYGGSQPLYGTLDSSDWGKGNTFIGTFNTASYYKLTSNSFPLPISMVNKTGQTQFEVKSSRENAPTSGTAPTGLERIDLDTGTTTTYLKVTYYTGPPAAPTLNSLTADSSNQLSANFNDNSTDEDDFHFYASTAPSATTESFDRYISNIAAKQGTGARSREISTTNLVGDPLLPNTRYYVRSKAHQHPIDQFSSSYSNELSKYTLAKAPANTAATPDYDEVQGYHNDLSWDDGDPLHLATRYHIYYYTPEEGSWTQIGAESITGTSFTHSPVDPGKTYYYRIHSVNADGVENETPASVSVPPAATAINALAIPDYSATDGYHVHLSWEAADITRPASRYHIYYSTDGLSWTQTGGEGVTTPYYKHTSLNTNTTYYYKIYGVNEEGIESLIPAWASASIEEMGPSYSSTADTKIYKKYPTTNYGSSSYLEVGDYEDAQRALLRFNLSSAVPPGSTVHNASLQLYYFSSYLNPAGRNIGVYKLTSPLDNTSSLNWGESSVAWNSFDPDGGSWATLNPSGASAAVPSGSSVWMKWDVTDIVKDAVSMTGAWFTGTDSSHSGGVQKYSNQTGATATFTFTGTSVSWIGAKYSNRGIAKAYLDDVYQQDVDLYSSDWESQRRLYSKSGLINTTHTLKIEVKGTKNASSSNYYVPVDAFEVGIPTRTEDTSGFISWNPSIGTNPDTNWVRYIGGKYSGGGTTYTRKTGATASFSFTGDQITWLAAKANNRGIARVYIDEVFDMDVDLYAGSASYQPVYTKSSLLPGPHTIKIEVTGTKNETAPSSDYYVDVDAFDVGTGITRYEEADSAVSYTGSLGSIVNLVAKFEDESPGTGNDNKVGFYSKESTSSAYRPKLIVNYSPMIPTAPVLGSLTADSSSQVSASLTDKSYNEDDFHFYFGEASGPTTDSAQVDSVASADTGRTYSKSFGSLTPNTRYYVRAKAHEHTDNLFSSYSSELSKYTLSNPPANFKAIKAGEGQIDLSWEANGNPSGTIYELKSGSTVIYFGPNLSFSHSGLTETQYSYRLRAKNGDGVYTSWVGPLTVNTGINPHANYTQDTEQCAVCHSSHAATIDQLIRASQDVVYQADFCYSCHDGTGSKYSVKEAFEGNVSHHPIKSASSPDGNLNCTNCHNPHGDRIDPSDLSKGYYPKLLRAKDSSGNVVYKGNEFCGACHGEGSTLIGGDHLTAFNAIPHNIMTPEPDSGTEIKCVNCHGNNNSSGGEGTAPHGSDYLRLTLLNEEVLCYLCHDDAANSVSGINILERFTVGASLASRHNVNTSEQVDADPNTSGNQPSKIECINCHNPHKNDRENKMANPDNTLVNYAATMPDPKLYPKYVSQPGNMYPEYISQPDYTGKDSVIYSNSPNISGAVDDLRVGYEGEKRRTLLEFDLSKVPVGSTITKATLLLHSSGTFGSYDGIDNNPLTNPLSLNLYRALVPWSETEVNWSNQPLYDATVAASTQVKEDFRDPVFRVAEWDITSLISNWVNNPSAYPNYGVILIAPQAEAGTTNWYETFISSDYILENPRDYNWGWSPWPKLSVEYSNPNPPKIVDEIKFCLKCHDGDPPPGVVVPYLEKDADTDYGIRKDILNIAANYLRTDGKGDLHGAKTGVVLPKSQWFLTADDWSEAGFLGPYYPGMPALPCSECHDPHGSKNIFHLKENVNKKTNIAVDASGMSEFCYSCHVIWAHGLGDCTYCHFHGAEADVINNSNF